jgi:hypothetical protein
MNFSVRPARDAGLAQSTEKLFSQILDYQLKFEDTKLFQMEAFILKKNLAKLSYEAK